MSSSNGILRIYKIKRSENQNSSFCSSFIPYHSNKHQKSWKSKKNHDLNLMEHQWEINIMSWHQFQSKQNNKLSATGIIPAIFGFVWSSLSQVWIRIQRRKINMLNGLIEQLDCTGDEIIPLYLYTTISNSHFILMYFIYHRKYKKKLWKYFIKLGKFKW